MGSVYWFHSTVVPLAYVPVWCCVLIWQVWSQWIICHILSVHDVVTYVICHFWQRFLHFMCQSSYIWQYLLAIKMGRKWYKKSDLTELHLRVQNNGLLRRKHFVAGFSWGWAADLPFNTMGEVAISQARLAICEALFVLLYNSFLESILTFK